MSGTLIFLTCPGSRLTLEVLTVVTMKITVSSDVTPVSSKLYLEYGGSRFLQSNGDLQPDYTASYPTKH
jgi:hypothetical protein